jgi:hypothetical protein
MYKHKTRDYAEAITKEFVSNIHIYIIYMRKQKCDYTKTVWEEFILETYCFRGIKTNLKFLVSGILSKFLSKAERVFATRTQYRVNSP